MITIKIDGKKINVPNHYTILQAAQSIGISIPHFCFHERLSISGNCRMCLVEVKGLSPKPVASCAIEVITLQTSSSGEIPEIFTNTPMIQQSRYGVMEFLLINHPLDCPICDQGGECDLQDQSLSFGRDFSRYREEKRSVSDKYIGPLIKTSMTRCIHCTRCIRFSTEVAGIPELGMTGRGEDIEIMTYLKGSVTSELQGNMIDLCPVGALTSLPYSFTARPWELSKIESIDVMDALGSSIRIDVRDDKIMRILPRINENINEEWISDKSRFIWDGLNNQRLDRPYIRDSKGHLNASNWEEAFLKIKSVIIKNKENMISGIAGDLATVEEMYSLKLLLKNLGSEYVDCRQDYTSLDPSLGRSTYIFNSQISGIEDSDALLIIGSNPRFEAPVLNARIFKKTRMFNYPIGVIGAKEELLYSYEYLGDNTQILSELSEGHGDFFKILKNAKKPLIIIGQGALNQSNGINILNVIAKLAVSVGAVSESWNGFSILHTSASRVGGLDIGFFNKLLSIDDIVKNSKVLFLLGADELDLSERSGFTIYIGSHGDNGAEISDVILPAMTYTEKSGLYVNTEGRVQMTQCAVFSPGQAKEDWRIIRALSEVIGHRLPFNSLNDLRKELIRKFPHFGKINKILPGNINDILNLSKKSSKIEKSFPISTIKDFYHTNPIARSSKIMNECSKLFSKKTLFAKKNI